MSLHCFIYTKCIRTSSTFYHKKNCASLMVPLFYLFNNFLYCQTEISNDWSVWMGWLTQNSVSRHIKRKLHFQWVLCRCNKYKIYEIFLRIRFLQQVMHLPFNVIKYRRNWSPANFFFDIVMISALIGVGVCSNSNIDSFERRIADKYVERCHYLF